MVNHSTLCKSIEYDYMNILTLSILKKTQILNGCETFAFKYIFSLCIRSRKNDSANGMPENVASRRILTKMAASVFHRIYSNIKKNCRYKSLINGYLSHEEAG